MNKDERNVKSFYKTCFAILTIGILSYNSSVFGWLYPYNTFGLLPDAYSQSPYVAAMDVLHIPNSTESHIWCAKYYYDYNTGAVGVEAIFIDYKYVYPNRTCTVNPPERFAPTGQWMEPSCSPAICIHWSCNYPQVLCKDWSHGHHLIHYYRYPGPPVQWVPTYVTTTECQGSPAMICNQIVPYNFEVIYRDWNGNYRHFWRDDNGFVWHEDGALLPLPSGCQAYGDPVMTQTTDGKIHVAAIVWQNGGYSVAHWSRDAHGTNWNTATVGAVGIPGVHPVTQLSRPAIVEISSNGIVVICRSQVSTNNTLGGFKTHFNAGDHLYYYTGGELRLSKYNPDNSLKIPGWNDNGKIYNIAGVYIRWENEIVLNVTQMYNDYSTKDFLIETHLPPD